jgi:hypothetical protein
MSHSDWIKIISNCDPELVDDKIHYFIDSLYENNCKIILLTARNEILRNATNEHIDKLNLNVDKNNIYFNGDKGDELLRIITHNYPEIRNIIVIDDLEENLIDVQQKLENNNYNLFLYKMN